ncbi:MAG TPA: GAF and ANTAR domain-containing protein [Actinoplanes sp.]|nr:GAF and ANTAR domain-containing protein [Actinoplanes sp.]
MTTTKATTTPPVDPQSAESHSVELAGLLHELTALLMDAVDLPEGLTRLASLTARSMPGVLRCSVTLVGDGTPLTLAASGAHARELDDIQYAEGLGPGLDTTRSRTPTTCQDLTADERWPALHDCARRFGVHSVASVPLDVQRHFVGALNVYLQRRGSVDPAVLITAMALAAQAELLLGEVIRRNAESAVTADLVASLRVGATIEQGIGVLVAQRGCDAQEAHAVLFETAQRLDLRPEVVAERLLATASRRSAAAKAAERKAAEREHTGQQVIEVGKQ